MKWKRSVLPVLVVVCFALAGCSSSTGSTQAAAYPDDKLVMQRGDTYSAGLWGGSLPDEVNMGQFTGMAALLLLAVPVGGGELFIDYDQTVTSGDFKTVLVMYGESVELMCEGTGAEEKSFTLTAGDYAIKAVGLDASSRLIAQIKASEGIEADIPGDAFDSSTPVTLEPLAA